MCVCVLLCHHTTCCSLHWFLLNKWCLSNIQPLKLTWYQQKPQTASVINSKWSHTSCIKLATSLRGRISVSFFHIPIWLTRFWCHNEWRWHSCWIWVDSRGVSAAPDGACGKGFDWEKRFQARCWEVTGCSQMLGSVDPAETQLVAVDAGLARLCPNQITDGAEATAQNKTGIVCNF